MRSIFILGVCALLYSCGGNIREQSDTSMDTTVSSQLTAAPLDSTVNLSLSPEELRDDSVFTDGSIPASWQNAGFTDPEGFKKFLKQVQYWVMENDKEHLAAIIKYPLNDTVKVPQDFINHYDQLFTRSVKLSFAGIHFNQIFRNQNGAMTDAGKVWFAPIQKEYKIIAINN